MRDFEGYEGILWDFKVFFLSNMFLHPTSSWDPKILRTQILFGTQNLFGSKIWDPKNFRINIAFCQIFLGSKFKPFSLDKYCFGQLIFKPIPPSKVNVFNTAFWRNYRGTHQRVELLISGWWWPFLVTIIHLSKNPYLGKSPTYCRNQGRFDSHFFCWTKNIFGH